MMWFHAEVVVKTLVVSVLSTVCKFGFPGH